MVGWTKKIYKHEAIVCAVLVLLFTLTAGLNGKLIRHKAKAAVGTTRVDSVTTNYEDYASEGSTVSDVKVPKYEKFELTFDIKRLNSSGDTVLNDLNTEIENGDINPYWPYEENPVPNQYFTDNHPAWSGDANYVAGNNHVQKDGIIYAAIKSTPSIWTVGTTYAKNSIVKYPDGNLYTNITSNSGGDKATDANKPNETSSVWQLKGLISEYLTPGDESNKWQEFWLANPSSTPVLPGSGISVTGYFLPPNESDWNKAVAQPGFYYQAYSGTLPVGTPKWKIRFAPTIQDAEHSYKYKIEIKDASGSTITQEKTFKVIDSTNHGFAKVSPTDSRYFETSDGTNLPLIGLSDPGVNNYSQLSNMGINLVRSWWQSSNPSLALFGAGGQGGDLVISNLNYTTDYVLPGHLVSSKVANLGSSPDRAWNTINKIVPIEKNKKYRFKCKVKTVGVTGTGDYGLFIGEYPSMQKSPRLTGDNDWKDVSIDINSDLKSELRVYVGEMSVTGGTSYLSDWSLKEVNTNNTVSEEDDVLGLELLPRPDLQSHTQYSQSISGKIDDLLTEAKKNNIYVKAVIEEKDDSFFSRIGADGNWVGSTSSNVYANSNSANRTYQQYYWRYLIARFGYSTALFGVELFNEADPFNGDHYNATAALGSYVSNNDPNRHVASTSNWHSFPPAMWQNSSIGNSDIHMYLGTKVASGGNRLFPGWDGSWTEANYTTNPGSLFAIDNSVAHSGDNSLKVTVPSSPNNYNDEFINSNIRFNVGTPLGHTIKVSMWVKGQNLKYYPYDEWINPGGIAMQYSEGGGDFAGYPSGTGTASAPWGEQYDWQKIEYTFTVPTAALSGSGGRLPRIMWVRPYVRTTNSETNGFIWIDDFQMEDLTSGTTLNYNGGFENWTSESFDLVAGHSAYSQILNGYQLGKPAVRGEVGVCGLQLFGKVFKGITYTATSSVPGEDQRLINDTEGTWWKKWVWSNLDSGGLTEIYWWSNLLLSRNLAFGKAYQKFMADISLSNGRYKDIKAGASNIKIRVLGQKQINNSTNKADKAHLWIDNTSYTWKAVADHNFNPADIAWSSTATYAITSIASDPTDASKIYKSRQDSNTNHALSDSDWWDDRSSDWWTLLDMSSSDPALPDSVSGTVTIPDMQNGKYKVEWWNTSTGAVSRTEVAEAKNNGISITVNDLESDIAVKLYAIYAPSVEVKSPIDSSSTLDSSATVHYTADGQEKTKTFDSLAVGENQLTITEANTDDPTLTTTTSIKVTRKPAIAINKDSYSGGWNMISFPYLADSLLGKTLPDTFKIRRYNASANSYDKLEGSDTKLSIGTGYWVKVDDVSKLDNFKYESNGASSINVSVSKGWNFLGNPFDSNLPLSNLTVKYKNGSTASYGEALSKKEVAGYVWSYEATVSPKQYYFVALSPDNYKTAAGTHKQTFIGPFRGFWAIIKSDNIESVVMNK